ncbi:hypothetical protein ElyMa_004794100 [Elysia marginata]|uniref:Uncharacterized protein n=1 Tax=Elysia marginata TaxID=1093978 RepID=A0AAV4IIN2_9GAST|nr:hypothetical protein ElyMa_004794100 [Elysia marginata]
MIVHILGLVELEKDSTFACLPPCTQQFRIPVTKYISILPPRHWLFVPSPWSQQHQRHRPHSTNCNMLQRSGSCMSTVVMRIATGREEKVGWFRDELAGGGAKYSSHAYEKTNTLDWIGQGTASG